MDDFAQFLNEICVFIASNAENDYLCALIKE